MTNRFLKIGFLLLVILNISLIFFLFPKRGNEQRPRDFKANRAGSPVERISTELKFSADQRAKLHDFFDRHKDAMDAIFSRQRRAKEALFDLIIADSSSNEKTVLEEIAAIEIERDKQTLKHIREIKSLCTEAQLKKFPRIIKKLLHSGKGKRRGPPPRR